jgi:spore maturation protein CgeB
MRRGALLGAGHNVVSVDKTYVPTGLLGLSVRALNRLGYAADPSRVNARLLASVLNDKPQLVWIDKGLCVTPRTLRAIRILQPVAQIVHYSPDDMGGRHNQSRQYLDSVPLYDLHVTTKSFNVAEVKRWGARAVIFLNNAYSSDLHRPLDISAEDRLAFGGDVGFVGAFEKDRAEALRFLASRGLRVRIWGGGWEGWARRNGDPNMRVEGRWLWGQEYVKALCSFEINLGFLRKLNRDLQTTRSVEIPACGGFMLAERTAEHRQLFTEGVEAEFFTTKDELLEKCCYYLAHSEEKARIAAAGRARCVQSGYSYERQVEAVLDQLSVLRAGRNCTALGA